MRVLLATCGSRGDTEPLVALAVRVRDLGADVRMCAPPDCAERLAEVGVPHVPVGPSARAPIQRAKPLTAEDVRRFTTEAIATQFDEIPAAAEGCAAVVTTGLLAAAIGVRSVAEKLGIPYFYAFHCPSYVPSPYYPPPPLGEPSTQDTIDIPAQWERNNQSAYQRYGGLLNSHRDAIGLPPVEDIFTFGYTDHPWVAADPVLAPLQPTDLDAVQTGAWILPDERPLSPELAAFLDAGPPPVYLGFGSLGAPADAVRVAIDAIRAHGRRVILSRGWADLVLPDDGADCFAIGEVNHQVLFGRVAAVIHHGGAGTTHVAARAGAPQILLPQMADQPYYAGRVAELGVGVAHDGPIPTFDSLSAALATALTPETHARATAVAGTIRTDGAAVAARLLLDAVSREKPTVSA
ncbi:glycosyltransferase [Kibdelosporangium aridum]|uniref:Vancomycin aglycone glucosyltransferase n=3 Tax=Pseudonocardiaceae TaxID=2070 RepID=GTFB_AMYOR|nr:glycosyltransferase [Kibdelosporangium aridum]P96559.1 RecName: Full=Vancomycin aglycone glucosyltransferase; AltName: Full=Glycosyltransferase GtfB [Amycolatopsis orientalis]AAB49293.1 glycosyltransferase GtfB [Amycolatopsis orientalis]RSM88008.1 glycosyltransferase [Kibdelosporangium aridum]CAA11775.1 PCZA361.20 [Amycolatopsis orientalis]